MDSAEFVVIGSGAFGASTAYHLARRRCGKVILLDQYGLGSQTSPRAAGLTGKVAANDLAARLATEAVESLATFEQESGIPLNFHRCGSLKAALTPEGEQLLRQDLDRARRFGIPAELISSDHARSLAPHFNAGDSRAVLYCPDDCWLDPPRLAVGYAERARRDGAEIRPGTKVLRVMHRKGKVTGVRTDKGNIAAGAVVDAAGAWSSLVAEKAGIRVPMLPTRHQLYITEPVEGMKPLQPIVRILEKSVYLRYEKGGILFGGYEDNPVQVDPHTLPADFEVSRLSLNLSVLQSMTQEVLPYFACLGKVAVREHRGGLPTMTPDGQRIVGPVPGLGGFFIITGCNVGGLSVSPALGRSLADLIVDGRSEPDLTPYCVERFAGRYTQPAELSAACRNMYARRYTK